MEGSRILVVDDDPTIRSQLRHLLEADRCEVQDASSLAAARAAFTDFRPEIVLLDYELPDGTALDLLPFLKEGAPDVPVLVLTGHREIDVAVATIKAGAEQFLTKPIELAALRTMVRRLIEQRLFVRRDRAGEVRRARYEPEPFLGESAVIRNLEREAKTVAGAESPVLLQGETGTGKGLLARWLHANSRRAKQAFVDLNCAGLSRELLDSELFGHAKGAFTGALAAKPGLFETADRGTFFLDEIGDTEVTLQPKILKVVEEKRFRRLGEVVERRVDIRLIAASNLDLGKAVAEKRFRADLYYRTQYADAAPAPAAPAPRGHSGARRVDPRSSRKRDRQAPRARSRRPSRSCVCTTGRGTSASSTTCSSELCSWREHRGSKPACWRSTGAPRRAEEPRATSEHLPGHPRGGRAALHRADPAAGERPGRSCRRPARASRAARSIIA